MLKHIIGSIAKRFMMSVCFLGFTTAFAAPTPIEAPIPLAIQSDSAAFNDALGTATYTGHVILEHQSRFLKSEKLVITRDKIGKIKSMIATGNPAQFYFYPIPKVSSSDKTPVIGEAKIIQYFPKEENVVFLRNATLQQNTAIIKGEHITYSLTQNTLVATPEAGKQTTIILAPLTGKKHL